MTMAGAAAAAARVERQVSGIVGRSWAGLDAVSFRTDVLRRLRRIVPVDAAFFATVDPVTLLFTSALAEDPLAAATPLFLDNEFGCRDVNKFAALAEARSPVASLDLATAGDRTASPRYREVMAPLGLGDELRAALVCGHHCWGVLCLHREESPSGFTPRELDLVRRLVPHLAEGLRRAVTADATGPRTPTGSQAAGILVLDADLGLVSMSAEAEQWLADVPAHHWPGVRELPLPVYAAAARLAFAERARTTDAPVPGTVRLRGRSGRWLSLHATRLRGPAGLQIGVVVQAAQPAELSSLLLSAHGLTGAQARVAALVLKGRSTRQIVAELHVSANTVQEHLTAIFDKFGVRSRRELVGAVLSAAAAPH